MPQEISKDILIQSLDLLESKGEYCENIRTIVNQCLEWDAGNIPYSIILEDDGFLRTKINERKVTYQ